MKAIFTLLILIFMVGAPSNAQWANYQPAELVIGQPNFTTYFSNLTTNGLWGPYAVAVDTEHSKLYVADTGNCRVLRYSYPIAANEPVAEMVFGQSNFITNAEREYYNAHGGEWRTPDAKQILMPMALAVYKGDLWVLDENNNRVVRFSKAYNIAQNNPSADLVIGQQTFITRDYSCTSSTFTTPWGMTIDKNGNLWVADTGNSRVLKFGNVSTLTNGASAVGVLGKDSFVDGGIRPFVEANSFGVYVSSIFADAGGSLWVCDRANARILRFDNLPENPMGESANGVLGQANFTSKLIATAPNSFNYPFGVCVDGKGNLYVADQYNNRVMIFLDAKNKPNGATADNWLGSSFYSNNYTYGNKSFAPQSITNLAIDDVNGKLFVADGLASRIMQFAASSTLTGIQNAIIQNQSVNFYPNPARDFVKINTKMQVKRISIFDLGGKIILSKSTNDDVVDVHTLRCGTYFLNVETETGKFEFKFVKQ